MTFEPHFQPDPKVQQLAEAYYLDAQDAARENWNIELDGSEESLKVLESVILSNLHDTIDSAPSEERVDLFAKMFGSYVGEVYRLHNGCEWGWVCVGEDRWVGIRQPSGGLCWPWERVQKRLLAGPEENVWHYYHLVMLGKGDGPTDKLSQRTEDKPSLFRRFFGRIFRRN